jgi:hypothetical protein
LPLAGEAALQKAKLFSLSGRSRCAGERLSQSVYLAKASINISTFREGFSLGKKVFLSARRQQQQQHFSLFIYRQVSMEGKLPLPVCDFSKSRGAHTHGGFVLIGVALPLPTSTLASSLFFFRQRRKRLA